MTVARTAASIVAGHGCGIARVAPNDLDEQAWSRLDTARRPLGFWLRLLGAGSPALLAIPGGLETTRAFLSNLGLHLPVQWRALRGEQARLAWFACAAHAAAHLASGAAHHDARGLKPIQQVVLGMLEDARVERLAWQAQPGLRSLWRGFHLASPEHGGEFRVLLLRLARALIDEHYEDPHPWVRKGAELFFASDPQLGLPMDSSAALRSVASRLGNDIGQMRLQFNARTYVVEPAYRDDNAWIWANDPEQVQHAHAAQRSEGARSDPDPDPQQGASAGKPGTGRAGNARAVPVDPADAEPESDVAHPVPPDKAPPQASATLLTLYPEWDRLIGAYRAQWCTVVPTPAPEPDAAGAAAILMRRGALARRLHRLLRNSRVDQPVRRRAQPEGDTLDLDAAVADAIARRAGRAPEGRVYQRIERHRHDLDVLLLLDLSQSTQDPAPSGVGTVLELTREAALLGAMTIDLAGDHCAVHGFCSNGREEVRYTCLKDFDEPFDAAAQARIAAMQGALSTRMGAALRHASAALARRRSDRRLIIVITDGRPYDIDIHDPEYLLEDARRAVLEARRMGVPILGLTVDSAADPWAERIFGVRRFLSLASVESLPATLPVLYLRLSHA